MPPSLVVLLAWLGMLPLPDLEEGEASLGVRITPRGRRRPHPGRCPTSAPAPPAIRPAAPGAAETRARLAVPAELLHVVVELDAVAVRVEGVRDVVDAGVQLRRQRRCARSRRGPARKRTASAAGGSSRAGRRRTSQVLCGARPSSSRSAFGKERQRVVLGVGTQEDAAPPVDDGLLGASKPTTRGRSLGGVHVLDEEAHGADARDLEGTRQHHAVDVVGRRAAHPDVAVAGVDVDAVGDRVLDLLELVDLGQRRRFSEAAARTSSGLAVGRPSPPARCRSTARCVAVRVVDVGVPVGAGHVAADAADLHAGLGEPASRAADLGEAADLPGDLVNRHLGVADEPGRADRLGRLNRTKAWWSPP